MIISAEVFWWRRAALAKPLLDHVGMKNYGMQEWQVYGLVSKIRFVWQPPMSRYQHFHDFPLQLSHADADRNRNR